MVDTASPSGGGPVVVTLPDEIDITNAGFVAGQLRAALASGAAVVIADLTATTFCDCSGVRSLLLAHHHAAAGDIQFRLACSSARPGPPWPPRCGSRTWKTTWPPSTP